MPGSGVDGYFSGALGYPRRPGRPSAGRYEAELDGERPAAPDSRRMTALERAMRPDRRRHGAHGRRGYPSGRERDRRL